MENKYKSIILLQAENDVEEILKYISEELFNPSAALKLIEDIEKKIDLISRFPYSGTTLKDERITLGTEYRRIEVDNFVLIYKVVEAVKEVRIMAAFYGASNVIAKILNRI